MIPPLDVRQVSLVAGNGWVISFREGNCQVFEGIEKRIRSKTGRIRRMPSDYLLHALLDTLVDHYYVVLARIEEQVEQIEENTLAGEVRDAPQVIHRLKSELMSFRRIVFPTREAIGALLKGESDILTDASEPYFRDLYDHIIHVMEIVDGCRDRLLGMLDLHIAVTTQRTNDVMRVLTIVATIFIPLTFLASIYGMNFDHMPEIHTEAGYYVVLTVMAGLAALMVGWFRKKDWL
jgi:magnesium transporter